MATGLGKGRPTTAKGLSQHSSASYILGDVEPVTETQEKTVEQRFQFAKTTRCDLGISGGEVAAATLLFICLLIHTRFNYRLGRSSHIQRIPHFSRLHTLRVERSELETGHIRRVQSAA